MLPFLARHDEGKYRGWGLFDALENIFCSCLISFLHGLKI